MRSFYEPRDDHLFEHDAAKERQRMREDAIARRDELSAVEAKREAQREAAATLTTLETNKRQLLADYVAAGVEPISVDGMGRPLMSLSALISMGWSITTISGQNHLVRPSWYRAPTPVADEEPDIQFGEPRDG